jgi:hypothetical protein
MAVLAIRKAILKLSLDITAVLAKLRLNQKLKSWQQMKKTLLLLCNLALVSSLQAANIFWVSFHPDDATPSANASAAGFLQAPDAAYTQLLTANGHNVTRILTTGNPNLSLLNTADLVIISRSVPSGDYGDPISEAVAWNSVTAPTMILGGYILRNNRLGYTTGNTIPDTVGNVTMTITDPNHPIFSGLPLGPNNTLNFATTVTFNDVLQRGISVNTDPVAGSGTVLATVGTPGDPAVGGTLIGEWSAGSAMSTAAHGILGGPRLVFLTGSREQGITSEGAGIFDLTPEGSMLFLNAVNYIAIPEPSTMLLLALGGGLALFLRRRKS